MAVATVADAKKERLGAAAALRLARAASELFVAKGTKVVHVDLARDRPSDRALRALLLGPSGNLRAPTLRAGTTLLVGFDPAAYRRVLG